MIANLMMHQRPELKDAHDRFWTLIRNALHDRDITGPQRLSQEAEEFAVWKDPDLVLSQTCGMPYRTWLHDRVNLVGTPDYGLESCPAGYYRSALVVRADDKRTELRDFKGAKFAYNQSFSQSGFAAPYWHLKQLGFWFGSFLQTGQHLKSARAVAEGHADIASLDAVSWRLMVAHESFADGLRVLEWTAPTPGLPLITAHKYNPADIFDAVLQAIENLGLEDKSKLGILSLVRIPKQNYLAVANPPDTVAK